jgi:hypothetical protein
MDKKRLDAILEHGAVPKTQGECWTAAREGFRRAQKAHNSGELRDAVDRLRKVTALLDEARKTCRAPVQLEAMWDFGRKVEKEWDAVGDSIERSQDEK